jgi:hypothetical protein
MPPVIAIAIVSSLVTMLVMRRRWPMHQRRAVHADSRPGSRGAVRGPSVVVIVFAIHDHGWRWG